MIDLSYMDLSLTATSVPIVSASEVRAQEFFQMINNWSFLEIDKTDSIDDLNKSITVYAMNDAISVFGIEKKDNKITRIICYHIASHTEGDEIIDNFYDLGVKDKLYYDLVIIGGNSTSERLLDNILNNLPRIFKNHTIIGQFIYLIRHSNCDYVSVNMNGQGHLIYCLHNMD